jgi:hypothetical protein
MLHFSFPGKILMDWALFSGKLTMFLKPSIRLHFVPQYCEISLVTFLVAAVYPGMTAKEQLSIRIMRSKISIRKLVTDFSNK